MMKKALTIFSAFIIGLSALLSVQKASAHEGEQSHEYGVKKEYMEYVEKYKSEFHEMNQLNIEAMDYKKALLQNHDKLMDLSQKEEDQKIQEQMKPIKEEMRKNHEKMKELHMTMRKSFMEFRNAAKNEDTIAARNHLKAVIKAKKEMNTLLKEKVAITTKMIAVYQ